MRTLGLVLVGVLLAGTAWAQDRQKFLVRSGDQQIRVLDALYGQDERLCRAIDAVARQCDRRDYCEVRADDRLCGNPYSNVTKQLFIGYECGDGARRSITVDEGQVASIYCLGAESGANDGFNAPVDHSGRPPQGWQQGRLYIESADYGSSDRICDATAAFTYACDGERQCALEVDNDLCGDPARGTRKALLVRYWCNGRLAEREFAEGRSADLECR